MSPSPDLLCPLVANKGVETEEVTPVPPASAQGWHSRAQSWPSSAEEAPRDSQWVTKRARWAWQVKCLHSLLWQSVGDSIFSKQHMSPVELMRMEKNPLGRLGGPFSTVCSPAKSITLS